MKQWTINQQKAINTLDSNIIVSASAGSGKTSAMVERAISLITQHKVPIDRIMLLTFTNNSAREMKERLRVGLIDYAKNNEESIPFIREQLDNMGLADISTIDSFCLKIVQEFFEVVGLSPSVGIQSPEEEGDDIAKASENTIKRCEQDPAILNMMNTLSLRKDDSFLRIIRQMYTYLTAQPNRDEWLKACEAKYGDDIDFEHSVISTFPSMYYAKISHIYAEELRKLFKIATENEVGKKTKPESEYVLKVLGNIEPYEHCQTLRELFEAYNTPCEKAVKPRNKDVDKVLLSSVTDIRDEFDKFKKKLDTLFSCGDSYEQMVQNRYEAGRHVSEIIKAVRIFGEEYDKVKAEQNKIDFADMERYAMQILSDEGIASEIVERHDYVFVDEFQDTNYLQYSIIKKITKPERLFVVGDVKQCIYRFRLAEPDIFINTLYEWQKQDKAVFFNDNFRSDNEILDFVNCIFELLMTPDFGNIDYKNTGRFTIRENKNKPTISPVTILTSFPKSLEEKKDKSAEKDFKDEKGVYDIAKHKLKADESEQTEAGLIYNYIQSVIGKTIYVKGEEKIVEYSDIVLMYRNRNAPKDTLEILAKAGIPLNMGDFEGEIGRNELDVFMDYIQVINNSLDDYPLIGSLHSFIGGLSNLELATIKQKCMYKRSFYETCLAYIKTADDDISKKLKLFFEKADKYRFLSSTVELSSFLKQVFDESGYSTYLASQKDGQRVISAINGYIDKAKGKKYAVDLHSFVAHYLKTTDIKLKSAVSDANGVRVCTLHSSKGLEFPIVIFAGLDGRESNNTSGIVSDRELGIGVKYYNPTDRSINDTLDMKIIDMKKVKDEAEDKLRLLYVTLTRAQSALCIILPSEIKKCVYPFSSSSFGKWIDYAIRNDPKVASKVVKQEPYKFEETKTTERICPTEIQASDELNSLLNYVYPYEIATKTARKYSVSALNNEEKALTLPPIDPEEQSFSGTAHHVVMQYIDWTATTMEEVQREVDRLFNENVLQKEQYEEINVKEIYDCINSKIGELVRSGICYREQKFVIAKKGDDVLSNGYQENVLVQGIIDLLIVGDETVVVDFKRSKAGREKLIERYRTQLKLYGDAVKETYGKYPNKLLLYVFGRNEIIEIE